MTNMIKIVTLIVIVLFSFNSQAQNKLCKYSGDDISFSFKYPSELIEVVPQRPNVCSNVQTQDGKIAIIVGCKNFSLFASALLEDNLTLSDFWGTADGVKFLIFGDEEQRLKYKVQINELKSGMVIDGEDAWYKKSKMEVKRLDQTIKLYNAGYYILYGTSLIAITVGYSDPTHEVVAKRYLDLAAATFALNNKWIIK